MAQSSNEVRESDGNCFRLWIGNLDQRLGEYNLLKLVEKFGTLEEFDFLYHRSGPQVGQPRGYAFVTYKNVSSAERAVVALDGKGVGGKNLVVKWAHKQDETQFVAKKRIAPPILSVSSKPSVQSSDKNISREGRIAALEAKLKLLDKKEENVDVSPDVGGPSKPTNVIYNYVEQKNNYKNFNTYHPYARSKVIKKYR